MFIRTWGTTGSLPGRFAEPYAAAFDSAGNVYVADDLNSRIQKFTADGEFLALWGTEGSGDGQLFRPEGLAIDHDVLYVSERGNSRVQKFTLDGQHLGYLFNGIRPPGDIAVDSHGNIIVAIPEDTVGKLSRTGAVLAVWGGPGSGPGQFEAIAGIAIDKDDKVWIADNTNRNIQQFGNDGSYIRQIQVPLLAPGGIAVDSLGNLFVGSANHMSKFSDAGLLLAEWGASGTEPGNFRGGTGPELSRAGRIYVVDSGNNRIQEFGYGVPVFLNSWGDVKSIYKASSPIRKH